MFGEQLLNCYCLNMADKQDREVSVHDQPVTSKRLRLAATDAELRGDWVQADLFLQCSDRLLQLEAQNQAYRHALSSGVSIKLISKRKWYSS